MKNAEEYYNKLKNKEIIENDKNPFSKKNNKEEDHSKKEKRKSSIYLIKNKYKIKDDRLYYLYERIKNKIIEKKIPFKIEIPFIFYSCHINKQIHYSINKSKENLKNSEYYYEGIINDLLNYIYKFPKCSISKNIKSIHTPMKLLIEDGPHYQYQMDIWYLDDDIAQISGFNYILDIIDVFSKWVFSYPLVKKTGEEVLIALRKYNFIWFM